MGTYLHLDGDDGAFAGHAAEPVVAQPTSTRDPDLCIGLSIVKPYISLTAAEPATYYHYPTPPTGPPRLGKTVRGHERIQTSPF